jgi:hypothetical protein
LPDARKEKPVKRSPLKERPLPDPGEFLEGEREKRIAEGVMPWAVVAVAAALIAIVEWVQYFSGSPPTPIVFTVLAAGAILLSLFMWRRKKGRLRNISLGAQGEKVVGQMLEKLRADGYVVFHDIPGDGFNVDHVIVGPTGVFAIETKTISKPEHDAIVSYDGREIRVNGFKPDRDPVAQAGANAVYIRRIIQRRFEKCPYVRAVVLFPGWFVERQPKGCDVWVLNPKNLASFLKHDREVFGTEEVDAVAHALEIHIRTLRSVCQRDG